MPAPHNDTARSRLRRWLPLALLSAGLVLLGVSFAGISGLGGAPSPLAASLAGSKLDPLSRSIEAAQQELRNDPDDALSWARLGSAYVEQARATADPFYYEKAQGALQRSMRLQPEDNGETMIGLGALANARHDFAEARDWALGARELQPATGEVYGVLADALTQPSTGPGSVPADSIGSSGCGLSEVDGPDVTDCARNEAPGPTRSWWIAHPSGASLHPCW